MTEDEIYTDWSNKWRRADETGNYIQPYSEWRDIHYPSTFDVTITQVYAEINFKRLLRADKENIVTAVKRQHVMNFDYTAPGAFSTPVNYTINPAHVQSVVVIERDATHEDPWR